MRTDNVVLVSFLVGMIQGLLLPHQPQTSALMPKTQHAYYGFRLKAQQSKSISIGSGFCSIAKNTALYALTKCG